MNAIATKPEYKKIEAEGNALQVKANAIQIIDDDTRIEAAEALKSINIRVAQVEALTESPWRSALTAYEEVQAWRKDLIARFTGPKKTVASKIGEYDMKIAEKRRKEAEAAEAKARAEAEEQRRKEIEAARKAKDKEAMQALKEAPLVIAPAAPKTQEPTKVQGVSSRFEWRLKSIFNASAVPCEFHEISERKIKERIKSLGGGHGIPGVSAEQVPIVSGRI
jgi:hypothetical protein